MTHVVFIVNELLTTFLGDQPNQNSTPFCRWPLNHWATINTYIRWLKSIRHLRLILTDNCLMWYPLTPTVRKHQKSIKFALSLGLASQNHIYYFTLQVPSSVSICLWLPYRPSWRLLLPTFTTVVPGMDLYLPSFIVWVQVSVTAHTSCLRDC